MSPQVETAEEMDIARIAIALKLRACRRGSEDALRFMLDDLDEFMRPLGRSRRQREVFVRRLVTELVHLSANVEELEGMAFAAAAE